MIVRCAECGAPLVDGGCGNCRPTGLPVDKGERRIEAAATAREKTAWDQHRVTRKRHARPRATERR